MKTAFTTSIALLFSFGLSSSSLADDFSTLLQSAFKAHCIKCHGKGEKIKGKVNLLALKSGDDLLARPELLADLIRVLKDGEMPPEDEPDLSAGNREQMVSALEPMLRQALKTQSFGPTPIRRMNRFQYNNAVVDLLELDRDIFQLNERLLRRRQDYFRPETRKMPAEVRVSSRPLSKDIDNQRPEGFRGVAAFPQDKRAEHGFDNRADHLTLSPLLMESFLQLSQTIVESPDLNHKECRSWNRLFAPPASPARAPIDGRYEAETGGRVKLVGTPKGRAGPQNMQGFGSKWSGNAQLFWQCLEQGLELTVSLKVTEAGSGLRFGFTKALDYGTFEVYLNDAKIGESVDLYDPKVVRIDHDVSANIKSGQHTLKFKCVGKNNQSTNYFFGLDYIDVTGHEPSATSDPAAVAEIDAIRARLEKLLRRAFRRPVDPETLDRFTKFAQRQLASGVSFQDTMRTLVGAVLGMPEFLYSYETPDPVPLASGIDGKALNRAGADGKSLNREPKALASGADGKTPDPAPLAWGVDGKTLNREPKALASGADGKTLEQPRPAASAAGSPQRPLPGRQHVDDFELASRLAQFFWSSIPDDTLLDVAESGKLSDPETLDTQIDRMLDDRRSSRFCDNFPAQWLQLERLITSIPDPKKFSYFYYDGYRTSMHMISEPLLLFETIYIEDRSIVELLDAKFTWQSDRLRSNYEGQSKGGGDVQVQVFRRVPLDDPRRGGVITNAAVMTMTSTPTRTQPITRGAWVNAVIFNDPPEPPPADVPPLPEVDNEKLAKLTIRERLAEHRKRADCASCHNKLDPLGFALENYGPTGVWRDKYENGREVDVSGVLFNQHEFETVVEFKRLIIQEKQRFIRGFVSHLLSYALGRELGPADSPALDEMTTKAKAGEDQMRAVLKSVAMSEPFLHKNMQSRE